MLLRPTKDAIPLLQATRLEKPKKTWTEKASGFKTKNQTFLIFFCFFLPLFSLFYSKEKGMHH